MAQQRRNEAYVLNPIGGVFARRSASALGAGREAPATPRRAGSSWSFMPATRARNG